MCHHFELSTLLNWYQFMVYGNFFKKVSIYAILLLTYQKKRSSVVYISKTGVGSSHLANGWVPYPHKKKEKQNNIRIRI